MAFYYPQGIILAFETDCPTGWSVVSDLDGYYIKGSNVYGGTYGSSTHRHQVKNNNALSQTANGSGVVAESGSDSQGGIAHAHKHYLPTYIGYSNYVAHDPPYVKVMFCKKN